MGKIKRRMSGYWENFLNVFSVMQCIFNVGEYVKCLSPKPVVTDDDILQ